MIPFDNKYRLDTGTEMTTAAIICLAVFYLLQISDISWVGIEFCITNIFTKFEHEFNEKITYIVGDINKNAVGSTYIVGNFTIKKI